MPTLFDPQSRQRILERLDTLRPDSSPSWGTLTSPRMLAQLRDAFAITFGEEQLRLQPGFLSTACGRWLALRMPIPKGRIRAPAAFLETDPGDFDADRQAVRVSIDRFAIGPGQCWGTSPIFGRVSPHQWALLSYKHCHHHLIQFGC